MNLHAKHILAIDAILILGSLIGLVLIIGQGTPLVIAPLNDSITTNPSVLFVFERGDTILIDDNLDFTSPEEIHVADSLVVTLSAGTYYWKVVGALESEVRQLTILSSVDLRIHQEKDGQISVINSGSEELEVSVYSKGSLTGTHLVGVSESKTMSNIDKAIGGKK